MNNRTLRGLAAASIYGIGTMCLWPILSILVGLYVSIWVFFALISAAISLGMCWGLGLCALVAWARK